MTKELVDYFIKETNKKFDRLEVEMKSEFKDIKKRLNKLEHFKWKLTGVYAALTIIAGLILKFIG